MIDDVPYETLGQFEAKIAQAQMQHHEWVETSPEVINYHQPKGLGGSKFFIYKNIKVCEYGMVEKIEEENNMSVGEKIFGSSEGVAVQLPNTDVIE